MHQLLVEDKTFEKIDFTTSAIAKGAYEYCTFINCNFSNADLSGFQFLECSFTGCNLSLAKLVKTILRDVQFKNSKMLGLRFDTCEPFGLSVSFDTCVLNHSSFYGTKLKKTHFKNTQLHETDFTDCDATESVFQNCDFLKATFDNTLLQKADFRTAFNYSINPETNRIKRAKFSLAGISGLLDKYDIEIEG